MSELHPKISIVIPTRDRPEFVRHCLRYLRAQTFSDFEVIICDNYTNQSCKKEWEIYRTDRRFKYFSPENPLAMCDNWEFAISKASGTYVSVISEKYMLSPNALSTLFEVLELHPAELVSWWHENYSVKDISNDNIKGRYVPLLKPQNPSYFDPIELIKTRFSFEYAPYSRTLGASEVLGKIYSGCFHRDLIERIKKTYGRVFPPASPDITSMLSGLSLAKSCLDIGQPLMMVCSAPKISTGQQCYSDTSKIKAYFSQLNTHVQEDFANNLPIKGLWVGLSNYIARDYQNIQSKSTNTALRSLTINRTNLLIKVKRDLLAIKLWQSDEEREQLMLIWRSAVSECSREQQQYIQEQLLDNAPAKPSKQEIHFAGGREIDTYPHKLSAENRAKMNWLEHTVFRINDQYLYYDSLEEAYKYFTDYYLHSAKFLGLPCGSPNTEKKAFADDQTIQTQTNIA
jgi:glycosyltransferase involved in cell wall biosynthesis